MVTMPAQRDVGGDSALLGEVAMPISVSCPSVLPLTSLQGLRGEQALPFGTDRKMWDPGLQAPVWGHLLLVPPGRAELAPDPVGYKDCPVLPWEEQGLRGPHVTCVTSKGKC